LDFVTLYFTLSITTSKLTKTSHYTPYQQKLYNEIKRLKEVEGYGYRKISYILYEKGYKSVRINSIIKNNYVHSIYTKGLIREERINRGFENDLIEINFFKL
jgi:hypothetical protein